MWTPEQRQRINLEHALLHHEGMTQFSVYWDNATDTYSASGYTSSSSGRSYRLELPIPAGFPYSRPPLYITDPYPLRMADGQPVSSLGVSHSMHTLSPSNGCVQVCHWRDNRWHSGIYLYKVFLKGLIWIEAYEQHLATGRPLSEFVATMAERA